MTTLSRNPAAAEQHSHDLIVIGAGIYGACLTLLAARMGLRVLLLEARDFGWATSYNFLRTLHGGLRYLQKMDLPRFFESTAERAWFMREFPGLAEPLACLMPLYGRGALRAPVFRLALPLNDLLGWPANRRIPGDRALGRGRVLGADEVRQHFPLVDTRGLEGGALWHDGALPSPQLALMELLLRAADTGRAAALNYVRAEKLLVEGGQVRGVEATDTETGARRRFRAARVVNAAGPWCRELAARFHRDDPELFRYSIAWNVLFRRPALSAPPLRCSLAVRPDLPDARMYFLHGWNDRLMGGTIHDPWDGVEDNPMPGPEALERYLEHLNHGIPGLNLGLEDVEHIYSGLLPVREQGTSLLSTRPVIRDHGAAGGPRGLFSVSGVKYTTARRVAADTLARVFPGQRQPPDGPPPAACRAAALRLAWDWRPETADAGEMEALERAIDEQAALHLDDLVIRRASIGDNPQRALAAAPALARLFPWDEVRRREEVERVRRYFLERRPVSRAATP